MDHTSYEVKIVPEGAHTLDPYRFWFHFVDTGSFFVLGYFFDTIYR